MNDDDLALIEELKQMASVDKTGSRAICIPEPVTSDYDFLVHPDAAKYGDVLDLLKERGYRQEGNEQYAGQEGEGFLSFRKGCVNLIVTGNLQFKLRHRVATNVCKQLNLLRKADRIMIFQAVLYNNFNEASDDPIF